MNVTVHQKVDEFFRKYPKRHMPANQILVFANEDPAHVYYLLDGKVGQYDVTNKGQQVMVNIFKPPAFFPMSWAINNVSNQYLFEVMEPITMRVAPPGDVIAFLKEEPDVLFDLLARVYRGVDGVLRQNALLMEGNALSLLMFELVVSCLRFGKQDSRGGYDIAIKENELAARTGLARETISRNLVTLKNRGLIKSKPGFVYIHDIAKLQGALSEDAGLSL